MNKITAKIDTKTHCPIVTNIIHFLGLNRSTKAPPMKPPNNIGIVSILNARVVKRGEFV